MSAWSLEVGLVLLALVCASAAPPSRPSAALSAPRRISPR